MLLVGGLKMREWKMQEWKYRHEAIGKGRGWKMREWKNRHGNAGVENEGVQNVCLLLSELNIMNNSHH